MARQHSQGLLLAALLTLLGTVQADDEDAEPRRWYHIEVVLFENDSAAARESDEALLAEHQPAWPVPLGTLLPAADAPLRAGSTWALELAWQRRLPQVHVMPFGLGPDAYLAARLGAAQSRPRTTLSLEFLESLDTLEWTDPAPGADDSVAERDEAPDARESDNETGPEPAAPLQELAESLTDTAREQAPAVPPEWAFRAVAADRQLLNNAVRRLERHPDYRVLERMSWRAPLAPETRGLPLMVETSSSTLEVLGTVAIDLRRYLHARLDLYFRPTGDGSAAWAHTAQSRRMRSGETHYLDHPRIGALIRIEPLGTTNAQ